MASPFQQQALRRKITYLIWIVVLFSIALAWRRIDQRVLGVTIGGIDRQARDLAIREENRGEVDLTGAVVRLGLTGSRGLATCFLWNSAMEKQKKNQWNELEVLVRSLTKLQPHFITPWLFQSWNLAYNVSVESDRIRDKYFYISRGIELLGQGERQNRDHPDLRWSIGHYTMHKVMQSDETNYLRSLFQLSVIPPNERDPARFWKQGDEGPVFNWVEFEKFCREQPQLVRRLREGMHRDTLREKKRLFDCPTPDLVVRFLDENYQVPSIYRRVTQPVDDQGTPLPPHARSWVATRKDELLAPEDRFPVLPPPHERPYDAEALSSDSPLRFDTDGFAVAHAWFCYAQEPLPAPDELPGSSKPVTDRAHQRRPRHMTTLIFRNYPCQGRRYMAERLQQEGWFDEEEWDVSDWFQDVDDRSLAGKKVAVGGGGRKWSQEAWLRAYRAWERHGKENHILFDHQADEQNMRDRAERFAKRYRVPANALPPRLREEDLNEEEKREFRAARYLFEYEFYRKVSNFPHHLNRSFMESREATVATRKLFDRAEQLNLAGESLQALNLYRTPVALSAWEGRKLSPLDAWRELVLLKNKAFRRDSFTQEQSAEIQIRYLLLYNRQDGLDLKRRLAKAAALLPLVPKLAPETFRPPVVQGPFDRLDDEGEPLIEDRLMDLSLQRMGLPTSRLQLPAAPQTLGPPEGIGQPPQPRKGGGR